MSTFVMARLTFHEASRRWILWAALLLGLVFLGVYAVGFTEIHREMIREGNNEKFFIEGATSFFTMMGLYVVNFLSVMMAVLTSVDTLSGEIATGTIHTLVSKPVHRWEILLGKWLGFMGMLTLYLLLMAGGVMAIVYLVSGYVLPNALRGLALMWLNMATLLSVSFLGGTMLSTLANGVLAFGLYGVAFIGGWIEQFGAFQMIRNQTAIDIGILSSLVMPAEALWRRASFEMESPLVKAFGFFSPFTAVSVPSPLMVGYALLYAVVMLGLALRQFQKRDL